MRTLVQFALVLLSPVLFVVDAWSWPWSSTKLPGSDVKELTEETLDELLKVKTEPISVVLFYAPWSPYSHQVLPMWKQVAEKLAISDPPIPVGQIDAAKYPGVRARHEIQANPTIKLFIDDEAFQYPLHEQKTWTNVVNWINSHTQRDQVLDNTAEVDAFLEENPVAVIGLFLSDRDSNMFKKTSMHFDDVSFAMAFGKMSREISQYLVKSGKLSRMPTKFPTIIMMYQHDEESDVYGGDMGDYHLVDQFILSHRVPMVTEFAAETADQIFSSGMPTIFLFRDPESEAGQKAEDALVEASKTLRGSVVFALATDKNEGVQQQMFQELALDTLDASEFPTTRLVYRTTRSHQHRRSMDVKARKYRIDGTFGAREYLPVDTPEHYRSFAQQYIKGMINSYKRSEPVPVLYGNEAVIPAVGTTFQEIVLDSPQDVLVDFYAPWCGHCRQFDSTYTQLGERMQALKATLRIVKVDATKNEVPVTIKGFPTILLYPAGKKDSPVEFRQRREIDTITKFLNDHCTHPLIVDFGLPKNDYAELHPEEL